MHILGKTRCVGLMCVKLKYQSWDRELGLGVTVVPLFVVSSDSNVTSVTDKCHSGTN